MRAVIVRRFSWPFVQVPDALSPNANIAEGFHRAQRPSAANSPSWRVEMDREKTPRSTTPERRASRAPTAAWAAADVYLTIRTLGGGGGPAPMRA
jgi:hypothetical protein